MTAAAESLANG